MGAGDDSNRFYIKTWCYWHSRFSDLLLEERKKRLMCSEILSDRHASDGHRYPWKKVDFFLLTYPLLREGLRLSDRVRFPVWFREAGFFVTTIKPSTGRSSPSIKAASRTAKNRFLLFPSKRSVWKLWLFDISMYSRGSVPQYNNGKS